MAKAKNETADKTSAVPATTTEPSAPPPPVETAPEPAPAPAVESIPAPAPAPAPVAPPNSDPHPAPLPPVGPLQAPVPAPAPAPVVDGKKRFEVFMKEMGVHVVPTVVEAENHYEAVKVYKDLCGIIETPHTPTVREVLADTKLGPVNQ